MHHQQRRVGMEQHLTGDRRIEHTCQDIPAIGTERYHVDMFVPHKLFDCQQQVAVGQHRMGDMCLRILLLEILVDSGQPYFIPFVFTCRDIEQMNVGIVRFDDFHKLIECHQVALIEGSGKSYIFRY